MEPIAWKNYPESRSPTLGTSPTSNFISVESLVIGCTLSYPDIFSLRRVLARKVLMRHQPINNIQVYAFLVYTNSQPLL